MRLPFVTASLFVAGTLLSLNPSPTATNTAAVSRSLESNFTLAGLLDTEANETIQESAPEQEAPAQEEQPKAKTTKANHTFVVVKKGDTLGKIAKAHNTTYKRIFDANKSISNPDVIEVGLKLRIPKANEKLASRSVPKVQPVRVAQSSRSYSNPVRTNAPAVASGSVWDRLAQCESGGNWQINTGNGYYGGLQFLPSTWRGVGGTGLPHQHSREEQIKRAEILLARSGWGQWPQCAAKLGLL